MSPVATLRVGLVQTPLAGVVIPNLDDFGCYFIKLPDDPAAFVCAFAPFHSFLATPDYVSSKCL
jgi:hypothetical protein